MNPEKLRKIWQIVKQIIEIILAAFAGAAVGSCSQAVNFLSQLL